MRGRVLGIAGAVAVVAIIGMGLSLRGGTSPEASEAVPRASHIPSLRRERAHVAPTPPPSGSLRIHGVVRDEHGPVAGVRVSATRPMSGETLSELPCPTDSQGGEGEQERKLPDCLEEAGALVLELVSAREGEAPVYAETVTAADGGFVLAGLPEGDFTLWALGEQGAQLRSGVKAGTQDVELMLNEGVHLEGIVLDLEEQPVAGVALTILHEQHTRFFDTRSGPDGRFRIGPLPKGEYGLTAEHEGWLPTFRHHASLEVLKGKVFLVRPSRLAGRVLLDGTPAPDAEVLVEARGCVTLTERKLRTNAEGRFTLERLGPCIYDFTAERDGLYAVRQVELNPQEASPELVLNLGQAFHVEGTVRDEARQPVEGALLTVKPEGEYLRSWEVVTTADGHYRVGPMEPGTYEFNLELAGYVDVLFEEHELERGTGPVDLTLRRAANVSGVVVDEEGKPVPDIQLQLSNAGAEPEDDFLSGDNTTSDAEGRFSLDASRAGAWTLHLNDARFMSRDLPIQAPAQELRIVLGRGATVVGTVTDEQGAPQARTSITLWKAATKASQKGSIRSTTTDPQGRFTLEGLPAGSFVVEAKRDGDGAERTAAKPVELRGSGQVEVALRFEAGRTLSGLVVDGSGEPVADAFVRVELPFGSFPSWRRHILTCQTGRDLGLSTGPDGRFTLKHLVEDTYELVARKEGYTFIPARAQGGVAASSSRGVALVGKGTTDVRLVLERQGRIRGRLVGPDGAPLRSFTVNGLHHAEPTGTFEQSFEASGVQGLELTAPNLAPVLRSVKVQAGVDVELGDVRMGPGRRVTGRVLDAATGAPIAEARVQVVDGLPGPEELSVESSSASALTSEDGTFELLRVDARSLRASHSGYRSSRVPLGSSGESVTLRLESGARLETTIQDHEGKPVSAYLSLEREDGTGRKLYSVREGTQVSQGVEPGLYVASVLPNDLQSTAVFLAQHVRIPASGRVVLSFVERREGATLVLRARGVTSAILLAGMEPLPVTRRNLDLWAARGLMAEEEDEGVLKLQYLPPGRATVLLISYGASARFHLEQLELPPEGVLERVIRPSWQPLPDE